MYLLIFHVPYSQKRLG
uniref:Uncharacterized protein n=1 Tax=Rhizophora mucronata TaxID=61149 RepID=A0A2P2R1G3_RHIMU